MIFPVIVQMSGQNSIKSLTLGQRGITF